MLLIAFKLVTLHFKEDFVSQTNNLTLNVDLTPPREAAEGENQLVIMSGTESITWLRCLIPLQPLQQARPPVTPPTRWIVVIHWLSFYIYFRMSAVDQTCSQSYQPITKV